MVLQSSPGLGLPKLIYLAVAAAAFGGACFAVWNLRGKRPAMFDAARPWLAVSLVLFGLIVLSLPVALSQGTPLSAWLRDAATYGLFAAAPVLALDAAATMRRGLLLGITVATGVLGSLSYAMYWIDSRNIAALPFTQLVLPTGSLPSVLLTVSLAAAILDRRRRLAWILLAGFALGAFFLTGTRSVLLELVALPAMAILAGRSLWSTSVGAAVGVGLVGGALAFAVQAGFVSASRSDGAAQLPSSVPSGAPQVSAGPPAGESPPPSDLVSGGEASSSSDAPAPTSRPPANPNTTIIERLQALLAAPDRDGSIRERLIQYEVAWNLFVENPVLGAGLGHSFVWTRLGGSVYSDFTADTPLVLPAKLGILGVAWALLLAFVWLAFIRRLRRMAGVTVIGLAMGAWAALVVVFIWAGFTVEDKGFSFAVMLVLALGFIEIETGAALDDRGG
jgi:hypothetical protein